MKGLFTVLISSIFLVGHAYAADNCQKKIQECVKQDIAWCAKPENKAQCTMSPEDYCKKQFPDCT